MNPTSLVDEVLQGLTWEDLKLLLVGNPSLRGYLHGYISEKHLSDHLLEISGVESVSKIRDHSEEKGDFRVFYKGECFRVELKSAVTNSLRYDFLNEAWEADVLVKGTDSKSVMLDGTEVRTCRLKKGEFDILAIGLPPIDGEWRYVFMDAMLLPESNYVGTIKTRFKINLSTTPGLSHSIAPLLEVKIKERTEANFGKQTYSVPDLLL